MSPSAPIRIVQITDTHLYADEKDALLGVNTQESFRALLDLVKADPFKPDFVLLTGDIAQDASEEAYLRMADQISELQVPVYCIPGNHDDSSVMARIYPRALVSMQRQLVFENWQLILLDSHIDHAVKGHLSPSELDFMEACLKMYPDHLALIVFHHPPIPIGCEWLDRLNVDNASEFWLRVAAYPQVRTVIFGHAHQEHEGEKNNIRYFCTPSTCIQFKTKSAKFALEELGPGYRKYELHANGEVKTSVHRVPRYIGKFQPNAKGY